MDSVEFELPDGTTLHVRHADLRDVYEALWDLADLRGAVSTAAVLLHESRQLAAHRRPVELNEAQGQALRQALVVLDGPQ